MNEVGSSSQNPFVSEADFLAVSCEKPIASSSVADVFDFAASYDKASADARLASDARSERVYAIIAELCRFHFQIDNVSRPYGPMWTSNGKRSTIPSDFAGPQSSALAAIADRLKSSPLRARITDVVWLNDRSKREMAELAIAAYCEVSEHLISGQLKSRFQLNASAPQELLSALQRAISIWIAINKRDVKAPLISRLALEGRAKAASAAEIQAYIRLSRMCLAYDWLDPLAVAQNAANFVTSLPTEVDGFAVEHVYDLSADAFAEAGDENASREMRILAAEQLVRMSDQMGSPMAAASWLMDAIAAYNRIRGTSVRRKELQNKLTKVQANSFDDFGIISSGPIDLTFIAHARIEIFSNLSLSEALGQLADLTRSRPVATMKEEALKGAREAPLASMIGGSILDAEGKIIAENPRMGPLDEPTAEWFMHQFSRHESIRRQIFVSGELEPVRRSMVSRLDIGDRHFANIVGHSPFVPDGGRMIVVRGLNLFFHGQMIEAVHLLIPQLENCVRHVFRVSGQETSVIKSDLIQEDVNLSSMLGRGREHMEGIFGEDLTLEIDLLFNRREGPALRHNLAHGKLTAGACFGPDCIYACWLVYRLTCIPLFPYWAEVSKQIDLSS